MKPHAIAHHPRCGRGGVKWRIARGVHFPVNRRAVLVVVLVALFATAGLRAAEIGSVDSNSSDANVTARWHLEDGEEDEYCRRLFAAAQRYNPRQLGACAPSLVYQIPGTRELRGWRHLDVARHKLLVLKLLVYRRGNVEFFRDPTATDAAIASQRTLGEYDRFVKNGGTARWLPKGVLARSADLAKSFGPHAIVELRTPTTEPLCPGAPRRTDIVGTYFVTADLDGPAPDFTGTAEALWGGLGRLLANRHEVLLAYGLQSLTIFRKGTDGALAKACAIESP